jgi:hypothetical protein
MQILLHFFGQVQNVVYLQLIKRVKAEGIKMSLFLYVCLTGLKKAKADGKQCYTKTMKSKRSW